ncbi:hypothetical protein AB0O31_03280 [Kitasatospora cineracea]|uniref:hypothetical protein n=1 Tax=Kitasatospora cineracea TaxID=88074 RepID=UPI0034241E66
MTTGPQHYAAAERLLARAVRAADDGHEGWAAALAAAAQGHALLAQVAAAGLAAAYPGGMPIPDYHEWAEAVSVLRAPALEVRGPDGRPVQPRDPAPVLAAALGAYAEAYPHHMWSVDSQAGRDRLADYLADALLIEPTDGTPYVPPPPDGPAQP